MQPLLNLIPNSAKIMSTSAITAIGIIIQVSFVRYFNKHLHCFNFNLIFSRIFSIPLHPVFYLLSLVDYDQNQMLLESKSLVLLDSYTLFPRTFCKIFFLRRKFIPNSVLLVVYFHLGSLVLKWL